MKKNIFRFLNLRQTIFAGFIVLVLVFLISAIYNYFTIQNSRNILTVLFEEKEPSVETLSDFKLLLTRSKMLTTNWVYMRNDDYSRKELLHLQKVEHPMLVKLLQNESKLWKDEFQEHLLSEILIKYGFLDKSQNDIQGLLSDVDSYNDITKKSTAEDILEGSILPITNELSHKIDILLEKKSDEKNKARLELLNSFNNLLSSILILGILLLLSGILGSTFLSTLISKPIMEVRNAIFLMSRGEIINKLPVVNIKELNQMSKAVNVLIDNFKNTSKFAEEIGNGNFEAKHNALSDNDVLGQSLIQMKNRLLRVANEEAKQRWVNDGFLDFSEKISKLPKDNNIWFNQIFNEIKYYSEAINGGIYFLNLDENGLEFKTGQGIDDSLLKALPLNSKGNIIIQVYDSKRVLKVKKFNELKVDFGILGMVIPSEVIMIPLMTGDMCVGVLMLGFLEEISISKEKYLEKVADIVADTYSYIHHNQRISALLEISLNQQNELKKNEIALEAHMEQLKTSETQAIKAKEKAELAMMEKSQFLSVMSHEIRTPMNAVIGLTNLLLESQLGKDENQNLKLLNFSAQNLLHLINEILDFNKIDSGKLALEKSDFSLSEVVSNVCDAQLIKAKEKGLEIYLTYDSNIPSVLKGDSLRLTQIFNNLVNNAVKFTEKGSITFDVKLISRKEEHVGVFFKISDTGIGIPADKLLSVFDNFSQASTDTTRKYGGTGLGLAITKKLIQIFGSEIHLESKEGVGSTFSFEIDFEISNLTIDQITHSKYDDYQDFSAIGKMNILLVDDNETNLMVASQFLKKWGVSFDLAFNGKEAVELTLKNRYDLILMDLQMPIMDGYEATKLIKAQNKNIKIIAMTAEAVNDIKNYAFDLGISDIITKPFSPKLLKQKVLGVALSVQENDFEDIYHINEELTLPKYVSTSKYEDMAEGDLEFLLSLLKQTYNDYSIYKQRYCNVIEGADLETFRKLIHKMKPTIEMLGAIVLIQEFRTQFDRLNSNIEYINSDEFKYSFDFANSVFDQVLEVLSLKIREVSYKLS